MKKLITVLLACMLVMTLAVSVSANSNNGYTYSAPYGTPTVDGTVDAVWADAAWANIKSRANDSAGEHARFKILHDDTYVYFLLQWNDAAPTGNENVKVYIHEHADLCDKGAECADFSQHQFVSNDTFWCHVDPNASKEGNTLIPVLPGELANANDGTVYTMEFSMKLHNTGIIANGNVRLELVFEDYNPDWQGPHAWNSLSGNANTHTDHGILTFLPGETADTTADTTANTTANTTADTTANEAADDKATQTPVTADLGLALGAVVMAAAAMVVLKKKH